MTTQQQTKAKIGDEVRTTEGRRGEVVRLSLCGQLATVNIGHGLTVQSRRAELRVLTPKGQRRPQ